MGKGEQSRQLGRNLEPFFANRAVKKLRKASECWKSNCSASLLSVRRAIIALGLSLSGAPGTDRDSSENSVSFPPPNVLPSRFINRELFRLTLTQACGTAFGFASLPPGESFPRIGPSGVSGVELRPVSAIHNVNSQGGSI